MWIADHWKDYAVLDCGGGEKIERWGNQILQRPDPQAIWPRDKDCKVWNKPNAIYHRSNAGGGKWEIRKLPEQWAIHYGDLTFQLKPMSFKHTGLFPEQAANWDFIDKMIRHAGRPINVLNLFAYTGGPSPRGPGAGFKPVWLHGGGHPGLYEGRGNGHPRGRQQGHGAVGQGERRVLRPE